MVVAEYESQDAGNEHWIEVGKALKAIDRNLFNSWKDWSDGFQSNYKCGVLWNYFEPRCCDVHSASYSGIRDTFLKLLRPGVNYKKVFERACEKKWIKASKQADDDEVGMKEYIKKTMKLKLTSDEDDEGALQEEFMDKVELDKRDMKAVMKDIGIKVEGEQLRQIVDSFDKNKDGTVSKREFLDFVTPATGGGESRPVVRGDTNAVLERKCIFESTCHKTGMPNAFVVTAVSKKPKSSVYKDRCITVTEMNNGEFRLRTELPELAKHKQILRSFGFDVDEDEAPRPPSCCEIAKWDKIDLYSEGGSTKDKKKKKGNDDDDYSDDDDDDDYSDDENGTDENDTTRKSVRVRRQKKALDALMEMSKENRAALTLKTMMDKGKPPPAPMLWCSDSEDDLETDKLRLCWSAQPGSFVAFFTLEISGALGSRAQQNNEFREIFRDPPDATYEADFGYWVEDLEPNTTYTFRLRAFNGFGAGPYVRGEFTTLPCPPARPVMISISTNSLTLRWKFGEKNAANFSSLRRLIEKEGEENARGATRFEFMLALEGKNVDLLGFLKSTIINGLGGISIYDAIESSDDDYLTAAEIDRYEQMLADDENDDEGKSSRGLSLTRTRYVVEQCLSEQDDDWKGVWNGSAGEAMIKGLDHGTSYRFR